MAFTDEQNEQIRNIKKYLLAALYNAPVTMDSSYSMRRSLTADSDDP